MQKPLLNIPSVNDIVYPIGSRESLTVLQVHNLSTTEGIATKVTCHDATLAYKVFDLCELSETPHIAEPLQLSCAHIFIPSWLQ